MLHLILHHHFLKHKFALCFLHCLTAKNKHRTRHEIPISIRSDDGNKKPIRIIIMMMAPIIRSKNYTYFTDIDG